MGSCTDLGDREEPLCKGTGQPGAQVWPCFSGPSFVSASPKTTFFLPKEQSLDPLLMLRGNFQYTLTSLDVSLQAEKNPLEVALQYIMSHDRKFTLAHRGCVTSQDLGSSLLCHLRLASVLRTGSRGCEMAAIAPGTTPSPTSF